MDKSELAIKVSKLQNKLRELSENDCETPMQKLKKLENLGDEIFPIIESPTLQHEDESTKGLTAELQLTIKNLDKIRGDLLSEIKNQLHNPNSDGNHSVYQPIADEPSPSNYDETARTTRTGRKKTLLSSNTKDIMPKLKDETPPKYSNQMVMDLQQKLLKDDVFVEDSKLLSERTTRLKRLEEELVGIQDLYIQVSDQTMSQGEQLDSIENNMATAANHSKAMKNEFNITIERNRWPKKLIISLFIISLICTAVIYFSFSRR